MSSFLKVNEKGGEAISVEGGKSKKRRRGKRKKCGEQKNNVNSEIRENDSEVEVPVEKVSDEGSGILELNQKEVNKSEEAISVEGGKSKKRRRRKRKKCGEQKNDVNSEIRENDSEVAVPVEKVSDEGSSILELNQKEVNKSEEARSVEVGTRKKCGGDKNDVNSENWENDSEVAVPVEKCSGIRAASINIMQEHIAELPPDHPINVLRKRRRNLEAIWNNAERRSPGLPAFVVTDAGEQLEITFDDPRWKIFRKQFGDLWDEVVENLLEIPWIFPNGESDEVETSPDFVHTAFQLIQRRMDDFVRELIQSKENIPNDVEAPDVSEQIAEFPESKEDILNKVGTRSIEIPPAIPDSAGEKIEAELGDSMSSCCVCPWLRALGKRFRQFARRISKFCRRRRSASSAPVA